MSSAIKHVIFFVLIVFYCGKAFAQDSTSTKNNDWKRRGFIDAGIYLANPGKESYVARGYELSPGIQASVSGYLFPKVLFGARYATFKGTVTDKQLVGDYSETRFSTFGVQLGYDLISNRRFQIRLQGGAGATTHIHTKSIPRDFRENGGSLWFNPQLNVPLWKWLALYIMPEYRVDFMATNVPAELKDAFGTISYLNASAGFQIRL
ncbi:hypothetical protein [Leeuwenhoekiella sp. H156]|uniref:hypothetical protein n=1 Tax=Leeuwenhoekiella sp. H156 TaxID=3450128 RepID=UPI003FA46A22